ncbi:hypothetical protein J1605_009415 [Eschrichtius robustus]|uniref:Basic proline-rich protein n=1 Tax=Eschrichtius robustus TaxID=9764 RepID=A0AB34GQM6_ESCRO|nr:hypothetical protein J1605_009415 [Eschrichtius robustus]
MGGAGGPGGVGATRPLGRSAPGPAPAWFPLLSRRALGSQPSLFRQPGCWRVRPPSLTGLLCGCGDVGDCGAAEETEGWGGGATAPAGDGEEGGRGTTGAPVKTTTLPGGAAAPWGPLCGPKTFSQTPSLVPGPPKAQSPGWAARPPCVPRGAREGPFRSSTKTPRCFSAPQGQPGPFPPRPRVRGAAFKPQSPKTRHQSTQNKTPSGEEAAPVRAGAGPLSSARVRFLLNHPAGPTARMPPGPPPAPPRRFSGAEAPFFCAPLRGRASRGEGSSRNPPAAKPRPKGPRARRPI